MYTYQNSVIGASLKWRRCVQNKVKVALAIAYWTALGEAISDAILCTVNWIKLKATEYFKKLAYYVASLTISVDAKRHHILGATLKRMGLQIHCFREQNVGCSETQHVFSETSAIALLSPMCHIFVVKKALYCLRFDKTLCRYLSCQREAVDIGYPSIQTIEVLPDHGFIPLCRSLPL